MCVVKVTNEVQVRYEICRATDEGTWYCDIRSQVGHSVGGNDHSCLPVCSHYSSEKLHWSRKKEWSDLRIAAARPASAHTWADVTQSCQCSRCLVLGFRSRHSSITQGSPQSRASRQSSWLPCRTSVRATLGAAPRHASGADPHEHCPGKTDHILKA